MNNVQIKEETNENECCDISRTIQRNVSNYFILVAVSLVFNVYHKEKWQDYIQYFCLCLLMILAGNL
jgi:hypothetical protein